MKRGIYCPPDEGVAKGREVDSLERGPHQTFCDTLGRGTSRRRGGEVNPKPETGSRSRKPANCKQHFLRDASWGFQLVNDLMTNVMRNQ